MGCWSSVPHPHVFGSVAGPTKTYLDTTDVVQKYEQCNKAEASRNEVPRKSGGLVDDFASPIQEHTYRGNDSCHTKA
jgi:hypothetical protein